MKKKRFFCLLLTFCMLLQYVSAGVHATQATDDASEPTSSAAATDPVITPDASYGSATVAYGCRTIDGKTPLAGSDQILETAQAAFLYEANTGTVIYSYNPDMVLSPGGLVKVMTALVAIEEGNMDEPITVSTRWNKLLPFRAVVADLKEGEEVTLGDLVHCMLVAGANDATLMIANHIAGDHSRFVEMMNKRAKELGCTDTTFSTSHGLDDNGQYTTARDMAKIVLAASKNPIFRKVFGTTKYVMPPNNKMEEGRILEPVNHLMYELVLPQFNDERVTGAFPSYTSLVSGSSLVCTAEDKDKGMSFVIVVMGGTRTIAPNGYTVKYYGNFEEVLDLLEFGFGKFKINQLLYSGMTLEQFPVVGGECSVVGMPDISADAVLPAEVHLKDLIFRYNLEKDKAPIAAEERIGTVQIWYRTSCITETEMYAMHSVQTAANSGLNIQGSSRDDSNFSGFAKYLLIFSLAIFISLALYLVINNARRAAARAKRRRRRASRRRSR